MTDHLENSETKSRAQARVEPLTSVDCIAIVLPARLDSHEPLNHDDGLSLTTMTDPTFPVRSAL